LEEQLFVDPCCIRPFDSSILQRPQFARCFFFPLFPFPRSSTKFIGYGSFPSDTTILGCLPPPSRPHRGPFFGHRFNEVGSGVFIRGAIPVPADHRRTASLCLRACSAARLQIFFPEEEGSLFYSLFFLAYKFSPLLLYRSVLLCQNSRLKRTCSSPIWAGEHRLNLRQYGDLVPPFSDPSTGSNFSQPFL